MGISARDTAPRAEGPAASAPSRRRRALPGGVVAATALAMVAAIAPQAMADTATTPAPQRIGGAPVLPHGAVRTAAPAADTALDLSVVLSPRDPAALTKFIADVSTPGSPLYHQYLKTGQFRSAFGATDATVAKVRAALKAKGLTAGALGSDGLTLPVHTTVGAAGKAFDTGFTGFRDPQGRAGISNTEAPEVRGDVAGAITAVTGLTTTAAVHSHLSAVTKKSFAAAPQGAGTAVAPRINGTTPALCSGIKNGVASIGWNDSQQYWSPRSLAGAYGMADQPNVGSGVTVGIFELESFSAKDIAAYQSCYGTHVAVSTVKVDGGAKVPANADLGIGAESALDIEDLIGLVPQASLVVYQGPDITDAHGNPGNVTYQNILDVYQKMVTDNRARVLSTSWGGCEQDTPPSFMAAENVIFQQAAAQGQTVTAASGDFGSSDCIADGTTSSGSQAVDDPASQPYVLGVGGTTMTGSGGSYQSTWNNYPSVRATGGGVSTYVTTDAANGFQAAANGPGYQNLCGAPAGEKCRQVPDVAALADPETGYLLAYGQESDGAQDWTIFGGTSGASPTWAALIAQADQDLTCAADGSVGWTHPALYQLPSTAFRDITTGDNEVPNSYGPTPGYNAGTGYDLTTGLGTPKARSIIPALCKAVPSSAAGTFTSVNPARILDTRAHIGVSTTTPVKANSAVTVQVTGVGGVNPPAGSTVTSVVLNTTAVAPTTAGHLIAYPDGSTMPVSSNLNWVAGQTVPNLVTLPVGADGKVKLYNASGGTVHFVADVFGYYSTSTAGDTYHPVGPNRILDTRAHIGVPTTTPVQAYGTLPVQIAGAGGVPVTGASAVVLNVTVTAPTASGHLTAYPDGTPQPTSSNLNWVKGETRPNQVVVPIGADGKIDLYNFGSTSHFVADVSGYYSADATGASFHSAGPSRLLDTRYGIGAPKVAPLTSAADLALNLNDGNVLANATAVVLNVTVTNGTNTSVLTVWPDGRARPSASSLNWTKNATVANLVTVPVIDGKVDFHVNYGSTAVIADVFGYFTN